MAKKKRRLAKDVTHRVAIHPAGPSGEAKSKSALHQMRKKVTKWWQGEGEEYRVKD